MENIINETEIKIPEQPKSRVYIKIDNNNHITQIEGEYSLSNLGDLSEAILIDEGFGDKYNHAQNNYLDKPLFDENFCHNYKYIDGNVVECTDEEKAQELAERQADEVVTPSQADRIEAQVLYTALMTDTLLEEV